MSAVVLRGIAISVFQQPTWQHQNSYTVCLYRLHCYINVNSSLYSTIIICIYPVFFSFTIKRLRREDGKNNSVGYVDTLSKNVPVAEPHLFLADRTAAPIGYWHDTVVCVRLFVCLSVRMSVHLSVCD